MAAWYSASDFPSYYAYINARSGHLKGTVAILMVAIKQGREEMSIFCLYLGAHVPSLRKWGAMSFKSFEKNNLDLFYI